VAIRGTVKQAVLLGFARTDFSHGGKSVKVAMFGMYWGRISTLTLLTLLSCSAHHLFSSPCVAVSAPGGENMADLEEG